MIRFRDITEKNFKAVLNMKTGEGKEFVPSNARSMAQAWLYRDNNDVYCFAIYDDETPVGFMQLDEDLEERTICLWRVMIDEQYQGKGFGSAAVRLIISLARESGKYDSMDLGCEPENTVGMHIYEKLGFQPTGEVDYGEVQMKLELGTD